MLPVNKFSFAKVCFALLLVMLISLPSARASQITWNLQNVIFGDGTQVTGSFVFDTITELPVSVNLTTFGGLSVPAENNWVLNPNINNGNQGIIVVDSTNANLFGAHIMSFGGNNFLDSPGLFPLNFFVAGTCSSSACFSYYSQTPSIPSSETGSGAFVSVPPAISQVPEPSTLLMLMTGLAGCGGVVRRRLMA